MEPAVTISLAEYELLKKVKDLIESGEHIGVVRIWMGSSMTVIQGDAVVKYLCTEIGNTNREIQSVKDKLMRSEIELALRKVPERRGFWSWF